MIKYEKVKTSWNTKTRAHFINIGYEFTRIGDELWVYSTELPGGSNVYITAICDECGSERKLTRHTYTDLCGHCGKSKNAKKLWQNPELRELFSSNYKKIDKETWDKIHKACSDKRGEKHHNWDPTIPEEERNRRRDAWRSERINIEWAKLVKEKYDYKCNICGSNEKLVSHHLMSYARYPELRVDVNNGVCLCEKCHKEFHRKYGVKHTVKQQFEEFKFYKQLNRSIFSVLSLPKISDNA